MGNEKQVTQIRTRSNLENLVPGEAVDIKIKSALWSGEAVYAGNKKTTSLRMIFIRQLTNKEQIEQVIIDPSEGHEEDDYYLITNHKSTNIIGICDGEYNGSAQLLRNVKLWREPA